MLGKEEEDDLDGYCCCAGAVGVKCRSLSHGFSFYGNDMPAQLMTMRT